MTFYNTLVIKTVVPLAVIALLWTRPLIYAVRSKPYAHAGQGAARISLFWMELVYVSVSTTIIQCFVCENIAGEGPRLRVQLSLPCDGTPRRRSFAYFSALMALVYPIGTCNVRRHLLRVEQVGGLYDAHSHPRSPCLGIPLLQFVLMWPNRHEIRKIMEAVKAEDDDQSDLMSVKQLTKRSRRVSITNIYDRLAFLSKRFQNFQPTCWCKFPAALALATPPQHLCTKDGAITTVPLHLISLHSCAGMGTLVLVTRLSQTSLMVIFNKQVVQANVASIVTLGAIVVQREQWPYRRSSEYVLFGLAGSLLFFQWC